MKKFSMKKTVVALSIGAAMGVAAQAANAESLLFPYYKFGAGVYSFLSLVNQTNGGINTTFMGQPNATGTDLHYVFQQKQGGLDNLKGACTHFDMHGLATQNDMVFQSLQPAAMGGADVGTMIHDGTQPLTAYLPTNASEGFLVVSSTGVEASLHGQMIMVDTTTGVAFATKGLNNTSTTLEGNFEEVFVSKPDYLFSWYPTNESGSLLAGSGVSTKWLVSATSAMDGAAAIDAMRTAALIASEGAAVGGQTMTFDGYNVGVSLDPVWGDAGGGGLSWDNDEHTVSGHLRPKVNCMATVTRTNILDQAQRNATINGGWTAVVANQGAFLNGAGGIDPSGIWSYGAWFRTAAANRWTPRAALATATNTHGAHVYKIESSAVLNRTVISAENGYTLNLPY